jgi:hypothetical protein
MPSGSSVVAIAPIGRRDDTRQDLAHRYVDRSEASCGQLLV